MQSFLKIALNFIIFFFLSISYSQSLDSLKISITDVENKNDFKEVALFFKEVENQKTNNNFKLLEEHLILAQKNLIWAVKEGTIEEQLLAKYFIFLYYNSNNNEVEIITRGNELISIPEFLKLPESIFTLFCLKASLERTDQFNTLLQILPLYYKHMEDYGAVFGVKLEQLVRF
ncbi:hypothetical protein [Polaribacter sp. Hel1_85]|uniref:hypothetical protein n=1 Tax=Polaribacter sp. Hel1_85 TaxID=1250005 RepID=UPI00052DECA9|nr:hypothetical protein [Polaribacter sp. Hel1_85]KGL58542.1 hypothetical protein PHEL85_2806 [Polaribacter sp. Hel1_85]